MSAPSFAGLGAGIYRGRVEHRRRAPRHGFAYSHVLIGIDLDRVDEQFRGRWLWSAERANLESFRRRDHFGDPARSLADCARELATQRCGQPVDGAVLLLTQLRHFGYVFNPVSFFLCFDRDRSLRAVLAEIHNTPWGERHVYALPQREARATPAGGWRFRFDKQFHISPFFPMQLGYVWSFDPTRDGLTITMHNLERGRSVFTSHLRLRFEPFTAGAAALALAAHPWMSFKTIAAIYFQALRLRLKRAKFFDHPRGSNAAGISALDTNTR